MNNLMTLWGETFQKLYPNVKIQIEGKGSTTAPPALIAGTSQFGPMSRAMKSTEIDQFEQKYGYKPTQIRTSYDALAVWVNKDNPLEKLTLAAGRRDLLEDAQARLQGGRQDLGPARPDRRLGRAARSACTAATPPPAPTASSRSTRSQNGDYKDTVKEQPGSASVVQGVTEDRFGMGYSGIGYKTSGVKPVKLAEKEGAPYYDGAYENVTSGKYPLSRFLYLYINKAPGKPLDPLVKEFVKLILSKEGQDVVVKDGYLPLTPEIVKQELAESACFGRRSGECGLAQRAARLRGGGHDRRTRPLATGLLPSQVRARCAPRLDIDLRERGTFEVDPKHQPVRAVVYDEREGHQLVAAELASGAIAVVRAGEDQTPTQATLHVEPSEAIRHLALVRTDAVVAATDRGFLYYWELDPEPRLLNRNAVASAPITALGLALGGSSILVGDQSGALSAWTRVRLHEEDTELALVRTHVFAPQSAAVLTLATSPRDKSFATAGADGSLWLRHLTSERTLLRFPPTRDLLQRLLITPKLDGILGQREDGVLKRYEISDRTRDHARRRSSARSGTRATRSPSTSGSPPAAPTTSRPSSAWCRSSYGTLKGTFYALFIAVPLALFAALYVSEFMHPASRRRSSRSSRSWPRCRASCSASSPGCGWRRWSSVVPGLFVLPFVLTVAILLTLAVWRLVPIAAGTGASGAEVFMLIPDRALAPGASRSRSAGRSRRPHGGDYRGWLLRALGHLRPAQLAGGRRRDGLRRRSRSSSRSPRTRSRTCRSICAPGRWRSARRAGRRRCASCSRPPARASSRPS